MRSLPPVGVRKTQRTLPFLSASPPVMEGVRYSWPLRVTSWQSPCRSMVRYGAAILGVLKVLLILLPFRPGGPSQCDGNATVVLWHRAMRWVIPRELWHSLGKLVACHHVHALSRTNCHRPWYGLRQKNVYLITPWTIPNIITVYCEHYYYY